MLLFFVLLILNQTLSSPCLEVIDRKGYNFTFEDNKLRYVKIAFDEKVETQDINPDIYQNCLSVVPFYLDGSCYGLIDDGPGVISVYIPLLIVEYESKYDNLGEAIINLVIMTYDDQDFDILFQKSINRRQNEHILFSAVYPGHLPFSSNLNIQTSTNTGLLGRRKFLLVLAVQYLGHSYGKIILYPGTSMYIGNKLNNLLYAK